MNTENTTQHVARLSVVQRLRSMKNTFEVRSLGTNNEPGEILMLAVQKVFSAKDHVDVYEGEDLTRPVMTIAAKSSLGLRANYEIVATDGKPLGSFEKDLRESTLTSVFRLSAAGVEARGVDRSAGTEIARGALQLSMAYDFDLTDLTTGAPVMSISHAASLKDAYVVDVVDARLDARIGAAVAVILDVLDAKNRARRIGRR